MTDLVSINDMSDDGTLKLNVELTLTWNIPPMAWNKRRCNIGMNLSTEACSRMIDGQFFDDVIVRLLYVS